MSLNRAAVKVEGVFYADEEGILLPNAFVTLQDKSGRQIQVFIGQVEAQALELGLLGAFFDRPRTYEAMIACLTVVGAVVEEVAITDIRFGTFYAAVSLRIGDQTHQIDMRPSDALNLAVRSKCPLFMNETVFDCLKQDSEPFPVTRAVENLSALPTSDPSDELARLFIDDQSDRRPQAGNQIDWAVVGPRDAARLARVKELYRNHALYTGEDFYHAAMVLQHAHEPLDYLLAHELCIAAVSKGIKEAKWLAAASEDRYLMSLGRPQRFGTQFRTDSSDGSLYLYEVDPNVNDALRIAFNVPLLSEARARAKPKIAKPEPPISGS